MNSYNQSYINPKHYVDNGNTIFEFKTKDCNGNIIKHINKSKVSKSSLSNNSINNINQIKNEKDNNLIKLSIENDFTLLNNKHYIDF